MKDHAFSNNGASSGICQVVGCGEPLTEHATLKLDNGLIVAVYQPDELMRRHIAEENRRLYARHYAQTLQPQIERMSKMDEFQQRLWLMQAFDEALQRYEATARSLPQSSTLPINPTDKPA
jgi:hypothetical protein